MTDELKILRAVAETGSVHPDTFSGKGAGIGKGIGRVVSRLVRLGYLEWERGNLPNSLNATALLITDAGRDTLARS